MESRSERSTPIQVVGLIAKPRQPSHHQDKIQAHEPLCRTDIFDVLVLLAALPQHKTWKMEPNVGLCVLATLSWVDGSAAGASAPTVRQEGLPQSTRNIQTGLRHP